MMIGLRRLRRADHSLSFLLHQERNVGTRWTLGGKHDFATSLPTPLATTGNCVEEPRYRLRRRSQNRRKFSTCPIDMKRKNAARYCPCGVCIRAASGI